MLGGYSAKCDALAATRVTRPALTGVGCRRPRQRATARPRIRSGRRRQSPKRDRRSAARASGRPRWPEPTRQAAPTRSRSGRGVRAATPGGRPSAESGAERIAPGRRAGSPAGRPRLVPSPGPDQRCPRSANTTGRGRSRPGRPAARGSPTRQCSPGSCRTAGLGREPSPVRHHHRPRALV